MAISETVLKDVALMAIDEINAKGGVLGKKLEPVVVDPASNWPLFAEKARQLITQDKVAVVFGCWTSVSRKSVLPVFEELNGLLFYPVQYEGEELSKNVFYTGAAPNQQAIPAVEYLMSKEGGGAKRWVLLGTDYVYPRTTNKILRAFLKSKGVADKDIDEKYTPFGHSDYQTIVADIKKFAAGGKTAVVSTINGDSNVPFYKELGNQGLKATDVPVVAFSVGEEELRGVDTKPLVGHLAAWNYFMSLKNPANDAFKKQWADYAKAKKLPGADKPLTNDPMEATYVGIHMWKQAVEKAKSTDTDKVVAAMAGQTFKAPDGFTIKMDEKNHHLWKPVFIGEVQANGQFNVVWKTQGPDPRAAVEPVHRRQREEEGRAGEEVAASVVVRPARGSGAVIDRAAAVPSCVADLFDAPCTIPCVHVVRRVAALLAVALLAALLRDRRAGDRAGARARARARRERREGQGDRRAGRQRRPRRAAAAAGAAATARCRPPARQVLHRQGRHARSMLATGAAVDAAARDARRRRAQQPRAPRARDGDRGAEARCRPIARRASPRRRRCRAAPTRRCCRRSQRALGQGAGCRDQGAADADAGDDRSSRAATRRRGSAAIRALGREPTIRTPRRCCCRCSRRRAASSSSPTATCAPRPSCRCARSRAGSRPARWSAACSAASASAAILLLAALGLAITYGLMGVINMAHGELIMIGAYATYVVQNLFRSYAARRVRLVPGRGGAGGVRASALVGMVLERSVIRFLYGRPLETLLATWGISLILIQAVRTMFGAQNVQVENPAWMSGGIELLLEPGAAVQPHRHHRLRRPRCVRADRGCC